MVELYEDIVDRQIIAKYEAKEKKGEIRYIDSKDALAGWYKSSERASHPHPKKLKVECSLDEDVVQWLEAKTSDDEEYPMYINFYLRKMMERGREP